MCDQDHAFDRIKESLQFKTKLFNVCEMIWKKKKYFEPKKKNPKIKKKFIYFWGIKILATHSNRKKKKPLKKKPPRKRFFPAIVLLRLPVHPPALLQLYHP